MAETFKHTLCQRPSCVEPARQVLSAEGTQHQLSVCNGDAWWAKTQIEQDFPARRVQTQYQPDPELLRWLEADNQLANHAIITVTDASSPMDRADDTDGDEP